MRRILQIAGYKVLLAKSVDEAFAQLGQHQKEIDVALLDLSLVGMDNRDGIAIAREIRRSWPHIKSIIVTGYGTEEVVRETLVRDENGQKLIEAFLGKEEIIDKLVDTIDRLLGAVREN
jgi:two-component system response regulator YesN